MPRKGNRCTTMVNFQLTPLEATALQAVVVHFLRLRCFWCGRWGRMVLAPSSNACQAGLFAPASSRLPAPRCVWSGVSRVRSLWDPLARLGDRSVGRAHPVRP